jgi:hypothetical protein
MYSTTKEIVPIHGVPVTLEIFDTQCSDVSGKAIFGCTIHCSCGTNDKEGRLLANFDPQQFSKDSMKKALLVSARRYMMAQFKAMETVA